MALSVKEIENAHPGERDRKLWDEKGLYLLIAATGSKRWYFKYRFSGKEKKLSFGGFPEVTLKAARAQRDDARAKIADDIDPARERRARKLKAEIEGANTFDVIAREFIENERAKNRAATTIAKQEWFLSILEPRLGRVPVVDIKAPILLTVLKEIERSGRRETAKRLRAFVGRVLNYAVATDRATITQRQRFEGCCCRWRSGATPRLLRKTSSACC